jgi:prepilin-type processing-associated H-X9-DG protein
MLFVDAGVSNNNPALLSQPGAPLSLGTAGPSEIHRPRGPLLEYVDRAYGLKIRAERHRRGGVNITFADGHGAFVRKFKGNPFNPTNDRSSDVMLPWWRFLPKVRVSPYNSGIYPSAE